MAKGKASRYTISTRPSQARTGSLLGLPSRLTISDQVPPAR